MDSYQFLAFEDLKIKKRLDSGARKLADLISHIHLGRPEAGRRSPECIRTCEMLNALPLFQDGWIAFDFRLPVNPQKSNPINLIV